MTLIPLSQADITAAQLRRLASELILQAEALEAESAKDRPVVQRDTNLMFGEIKTKRRKS
jgi:hypothetical protein